MQINQESVLYEDNHLLALFKPAGLLIQGDRTGDPTLIDMARGYIAKKYNKPGRVYIGLVHRLDRPVAGVVVFARTSKSAQRICEQFRKHQIKKTYWAMIEGKLNPPCGELKDSIIRHGRRSFINNSNNAKGQMAILAYTTIDSFPGFSLIEINPGTGRHHQIRVQMANKRHPILGDKKYGSKYSLPHRGIALLAKRLVLIHPIRLDELIIEVPVPANWPWTLRALSQ